MKTNTKVQVSKE